MSESSGALDRILASWRGGSSGVVNVDEPKIKLLILTLAEETFAIRGEFVREVLSDTAVFFLPGCPASLEGVISVRDEIETVIDLRRVLGFAPVPVRPDSRILLVRTPTMQSGLRVDRVDDVTDVLESALHAPPATIAEARKPIVEAVADLGGRMATLLDIDHIYKDYLNGLG
jgi:purine-binding chemotaxis protein CheW